MARASLISCQTAVASFDRTMFSLHDVRKLQYKADEDKELRRLKIAKI